MTSDLVATQLFQRQAGIGMIRPAMVAIKPPVGVRKLRTQSIEATLALFQRQLALCSLPPHLDSDASNFAPVMGDETCSWTCRYS
jgi:hypothetical protein